MPSWREVYGPRVFKADEIGTEGFRAEIIECRPYAYKKDNGVAEEKLVLALDGKVKGITLNVTNAERLAEAFGDDYADWVGEWVDVSTERTKYQGKPCLGIVLAPVAETELPPEHRKKKGRK